MSTLESSAPARAPSGHPHLEEAYQVGEGVLPELARRGALAPWP
ncbi:hypothetical protein [Actinomycetospora chibensis]|uniref:Uncharacterized protein n=1 Tax=Actinomycetospora chibensis TaxID=663606 RepID=A0ABV9RE67_9PSEU|nr:hypothetical protein [Actinomycetospora chibensis]MDD7922968.1 hypothetical protein [Actinomycetospora chibensis]